MLSLKIKSSFKSYDRFIWHFEDLHKTAVSDLVRNTSCGHWVNITGAGVAVFHTHVGLLAILAPLLQKIKTEPVAEQWRVVPQKCPLLEGQNVWTLSSFSTFKLRSHCSISVNT